MVRFGHVTIKKIRFLKFESQNLSILINLVIEFDKNWFSNFAYQIRKIKINNKFKWIRPGFITSEREYLYVEIHENLCDVIYRRLLV